MRTKDTDIMDVFKRKPIEVHGVSTPEKPLRQIPVNPDYEVPPEVSDQMSFNPGADGDPYAPFPYRTNINDERVDIYSGDGRLIASLFIENFSSHHEMVYTANLMSKAPEFCKAAQIALLDLGRFHFGCKKEDIDDSRYEEQNDIFFTAKESIHAEPCYMRELYEPIYPEEPSVILDESELPEDMLVNQMSGWVLPAKPFRC